MLHYLNEQLKYFMGKCYSVNDKPTDSQSYFWKNYTSRNLYNIVPNINYFGHAIIKYKE